MYYPSSENKGADQLRDYSEADRVFVLVYANSRFSQNEAHLRVCKIKNNLQVILHNLL